MKKTSLGYGTLYISVSSFIFIFSGYLINIWLGRFLGPDAYGAYGIIISLMTAINLTQTAGLPQAVAKFIAEDEKKADAVLKAGLVLQIGSTIGATILFLLLALPIAKLLKDVTLFPYLLSAAAVFPLYGIYSLYLNYYNGLHRFKTQALLSTIYAIAKLIAVVVLVYFFHLYGAIFGFIIAPFVALLFKFHIPKGTIYHFSYKKIILFSLPLIGVAIFSNLLQSIDLFFVKALLHSDKSTGFYTANQNIAEIPFYGVAALASVLFPSISRHVSQKLTTETKNLITKSLRFSLLIITPSILLISATSFQILQLFYSSAYTQGAQALAILAIGNGFFTLLVILMTIISGSGSPLKSSILAGIGLIISSVLCIFLIPHFGIVGAAVSTSLAMFIIMICASVVVYKKFTVLFNPKSAIKILAASLIIYVLAKIIILPVLLLPVLYIFLFAVYLGMLFLLGEITDEDIALPKSFVPNFFKRK